MLELFLRKLRFLKLSAHRFPIRTRYVLMVVSLASIAFNSDAQTSVVRVPQAPASLTLTLPINVGL